MPSAEHRRDYNSSTAAVRSNFERDVVIRPGSHQKVEPYLSAPLPRILHRAHVPKRDEPSTTTHIYMSRTKTANLQYNRKCILGQMHKKGIPIIVDFLPQRGAF